MPTYSSALLPNTNGLTFGSSALRWSCFLQDIDVAGTPTFSGRVGMANFEDIRFADQFPGGTVTQQIDAAITDIGSVGTVIVPSSMGPGAATTVGAGVLLIDLRVASAKPLRIFSGNSVTPKLTIGAAGVIAPSFTSTASDVASTGSLRLGNGDSIVFRNSTNTGNHFALTMNSDVITIGTAGEAVFINGTLGIAGAFTGGTTAAFSGQISSSLATGTAPFSITSTTVVPNLNVATLNGVTVSGSPTTGQSLVATGTTTAAWSGSAGVYKVESVQYTPTTFVSSAGGALFTYSLPANELALNQCLRITASGTYTNTSVATRTFAFTVKAGSTTLGGFSIFASSGSVTNKHWSAEFLLICTASGSSGTVEFQNITPVATLSGMTNPTDVTITANTATIAFDTTSIQSLTLNIAQTNDATTSSTGRQFLVERLG